MENKEHKNIEDIVQNNEYTKSNKNYQIQFLIFIIILVLVFFIFKLMSSFNPTSNTIDNTNQPKVSQTINTNLVQETPLLTDSKYITASGTYPVFTHSGPELNTAILNYVQNIKDEAELMAQENWQAMIETNTAPNVKLRQYPEAGDFYVDIKTDYVQLNEKYISAIMRVSVFSGGAHGYVALYPINYDVVNKKVITIKDVMAGDANYLDTLSTVSREKLYAKFSGKVSQADFKTVDEYNSYVKDTIYSMIDDGTKPEELNFSNFTFTDSEITVYFGQYQVASYADGEQQITIPRK